MNVVCENGFGDGLCLLVEEAVISDELVRSAQDNLLLVYFC